MIKKAVLNTKNIWFVDKLESFDMKSFKNIILAINKFKDVNLVKECPDDYNGKKVSLINFNYPEPLCVNLTLEQLFEIYEIYICDNLTEVAELVEKNGWKL